jgi:hypothetical protein
MDSTKSSSGRHNVSDKIKVLRGEGVPEKQAVAESLSMQRAGRLRPGGRYVRKGSRKGGR